MKYNNFIMIVKCLNVNSIKIIIIELILFYIIFIIHNILFYNTSSTVNILISVYKKKKIFHSK